MPVFNHGRVLPFAIDSVRAQTVDDWELIIVDDGSDDETPMVADLYSRLDRRIRVITSPGNSRRCPVPTEPRNLGFEAIRGRYVAYLDADNTWRPRFLADLLDFMESNPRFQLVHADSVNHSDPASVRLTLSIDERQLVASGDCWTLFTYERLRPEALGTRQYIDTNEILHRRGIFDGLGSAWAVCHERHAEIQRAQGFRYPYRRHNDLELVERVIRNYGAETVGHLRRPLVDYYYPSACRSVHPLWRRRSEAPGAVRTARLCDQVMSTRHGVEAGWIP
jgi:glycosyltransferase involved in cell wall biosynthesis